MIVLMPNALDVDKEGDAGDWRMHMVARIAQDSGHYKTNDILRHVVSAIGPSGVLFSYAVPSSVALALNSAEQAAKLAEQLKLKIPWQPTKSGEVTAFAVASEGLPPLYDYFEQCMVSAVFAYQAVEAFANAVIGREVRKPMKVPRGRKLKSMTPEQLARSLSTSEKLKWVLPVVRHVESPEGTSKWQRFERLEETRNATVHLKVSDQFGKDRFALFFRMLDMKSAEFPSAAVTIIHHYFKKGAEPRWLLKFLQFRDHS